MDRDLDAILATSATTDDEFEALWNRLLQPRPNSPTKQPIPPLRTLTVEQVKIKRPRCVPKVGTIIQRSSAANERKLLALMETPPPPPPRRVHDAGRPKRPAPAPRNILVDLFGDTLADLSDDDHASDVLAVSQQDAPSEPRASEYGTPKVAEPTPASTEEKNRPNDPPPVKVTTDDGVEIDVPYYAVHVSRRYKARVGNRRFLLRFDRAGKLRFNRAL